MQRNKMERVTARSSENTRQKYKTLCAESRSLTIHMVFKEGEYPPVSSVPLNTLGWYTEIFYNQPDTRNFQLDPDPLLETPSCHLHHIASRIYQIEAVPINPIYIRSILMQSIITVYNLSWESSKVRVAVNLSHHTVNTVMLKRNRWYFTYVLVLNASSFCRCVPCSHATDKQWTSVCLK